MEALLMMVKSKDWWGNSLIHGGLTGLLVILDTHWWSLVHGGPSGRSTAKRLGGWVSPCQRGSDATQAALMVDPYYHHQLIHKSLVFQDQESGGFLILISHDEYFLTVVNIFSINKYIEFQHKDCRRVQKVFGATPSVHFPILMTFSALSQWPVSKFQKLLLLMVKDASTDRPTSLISDLTHDNTYRTQRVRTLQTTGRLTLLRTRKECRARKARRGQGEPGCDSKQAMSPCP